MQGYIVLQAWYIKQNEAKSCMYDTSDYTSTHLPFFVFSRLKMQMCENILTKSSSTQILQFYIVFRSS